MKIPNETFGLIAVASSHVSTKIAKTASANTAHAAIDATTTTNAAIGDNGNNANNQRRSTFPWNLRIPDLYLHDNPDPLNGSNSNDPPSKENSNISPSQNLSPRQLAATDPSAVAATCDAAFLTCILSPTCRSCFATLQENDVDWTNVVPDTPCQDGLRPR